MLVKQLLNENLEKSSYLHLKGIGYLNNYLDQEVNSCAKELKQHIIAGIDKCFKQNSNVSLMSHPALIAYKGLKDTELFKNTLPLVEDYYLIGCTFKNWMLNNLNTPDYNKIIEKNIIKLIGCYLFHKYLKKY